MKAQRRSWGAWEVTWGPLGLTVDPTAVHRLTPSYCRVDGGAHLLTLSWGEPTSDPVWSIGVTVPRVRWPWEHRTGWRCTNCGALPRPEDLVVLRPGDRRIGVGDPQAFYHPYRKDRRLPCGPVVVDDPRRVHARD